MWHFPASSVRCTALQLGLSRDPPKNDTGITADQLVLSHHQTIQFDLRRIRCLGMARVHPPPPHPLGW
jgi:hypothetical protein